MSTWVQTYIRIWIHNLHYEKFQDGSVRCIEDEIPFDLPEGWEWCRVRNIASVLLERIRAEKEELIKQGKIKRDKKESIIFRGNDNSYYETINGETICIDDELPFELPEGWEWTRLQNISSILTDGTHKTPQYSDNGYIFLSSKNVTTGKMLCIYLRNYMNNCITVWHQNREIFFLQKWHHRCRSYRR